MIVSMSRRRVGEHQATHEREAAVDQADGEGEQRQRRDAGTVAACQGPVDQALRDERQVDGNHGSRQRGEDHKYQRVQMWSDVVAHAPQRL